MHRSRWVSSFGLVAAAFFAANPTAGCKSGGGAPAGLRDAGPARSPACGAVSTEASARCDSTRAGPCTIRINGVARQYYVVVPADYDAKTPYPLVFAWHYASGTAEALLPPMTDSVSAFFGVQPGFPEAIYVAPQGLPLDDGGTDYAWANTGGQDVDFARAMVARVESELCVDESRVFAAGMSFGGSMADILGCEAPDIFHAVCVMSGWLYVPSGRSCRPGAVRAWITHGTADTTVPIAGDVTARDQFLTQNGCDATRTRFVSLDENTTCTVYDACTTAGEPVVFCPVLGEGHVIPSWAGAAIATFFQGGVSGTQADASSPWPGDGASAFDARDATTTTPALALTVTNGVATAGPWTGAVATFVTPNPSSGTTISPACSGLACAPPFTGTPCASGTVGVDPKYSTVAGITFDFEGVDGGRTTRVMSGTALTIGFSNPGGSPLRVELVDASGAYWCQDLGSVSPVTIPLTSFATQCWSPGAGQAFAPGTQVAAIQMIASSSAFGDTPFDFCFSGVSVE